MNGFEQIADDPENMMDLSYRMDDIIVGRYRVLYGYRLRAGYFGDMTYELDICCGAPLDQYEAMLEMVTSIISHNIKVGNDPFKYIPKMSKIKPYPLDESFCKTLTNLYHWAKVEKI